MLHANLRSDAVMANRLPSLTGMRWIAASLVFFFHSAYEMFFNNPDANSIYFKIFGQGGWAGVGFFFVLSGFVLTWSVRGNDTARRFWRRRFFKIYPNHLVTFIAAAVLLIWVGATIDIGPAILNFFLLQSWSSSLAVEVSVNPVAWSLSCEALFYFCFPFLYRAITRIQPNRLWWWVMGLFAVVLVIPVVATALLPDSPMQPWAQASEWEFWAIYVLPPIRMIDFFIGMLLARIVITGRRLPFNVWQAGIFAVGAYILASYIPWVYSLTAVWVLPAGLLIAAGAVADIEGRRSWLSSAVMVWLGEISFALYMWHRLVLTYGHNILGGPTKNWNTFTAIGVIALLLVVNILLAWALYSWVERPVMRRFSVSRRNRNRPARPQGLVPGQPIPSHDNVVENPPDQPQKVGTTSS